MTTRWRPLRILTGLVALLALLSSLEAGGRQNHGNEINPGNAGPASSVEEATPDCGVPAPSADPVHQRAVHLAQLGVQRWHDAGYRGKGVKIAILDTGFHGYRGYLGKGLPAEVQTHCCRSDGNLEARESMHGVLCAEVLHAIAPEAQVLLATWEPDSYEHFLEAARWARSQGARIISCSVIMPSWSDSEGNGPVHEALKRIVGSGEGKEDLVCFASAGNTARRHWSGPFREGDNHFQEWQPGSTENAVWPWGSDRVSVELCCPPGSRYRLEVDDATAGSVVGQSNTPAEASRCCAVVRFNPTSGHRYHVRVQLLQGPAKPFHLVALGGDLKYATHQGSIPFPGDGAEVVAVGAVDAAGQRAPYSSCGPNSPCPKPDLVAPVPFPSWCRDRPFTGTSAAAPQAAGIAALCWARHPDWTAEQIRDALRRWARDLGPPGHDWETGYGMVMLPEP